MKKLLLIALLTNPLFAEIYSCNDDLLTFTLKRVTYSESFEQFQYQPRNENPLLYSITRETDDFLYLMRDAGGGASHFIVGKKDSSFVGVYLKYKQSSNVFNGECFLIKE
jgi:hypothetical protein